MVNEFPIFLFTAVFGIGTALFIGSYKYGDYIEKMRMEADGVKYNCFAKKLRLVEEAFESKQREVAEKLEALENEVFTV